MWKREPYSVPDSAFFLLGVLVSLVSYGALITAYHSYPDVIPVHYAADGAPDLFANKGFWSVFGLAVVHVVLTGLLFWIYSHPQYANIPGKIPLLKLKKPYRSSIEWIIRHMALMLFVMVSLIFSYLTFSGVVIALGFAAGLNNVPIAVLLLVLIGIMAAYIFMIVKITKLAAKRKKLPAGW